MPWISHVGAVVFFGVEAFRLGFTHGFGFKSVLNQIYEVGVRSISTVTVTGIFVGAIMAIQIHLQLRDFGASGFLGGLTSSVTIRNVGPVLIAFLLSGKVGAFTSAELGTMQVTDQINAIRCLGVNPVAYLVVPRLIAVTFASFLLLVLGLLASIGGGVLISSIYLGVNEIAFVRNIPAVVDGWSIAMGIGKSFVFGALIGIISCYRGYHAQGGAEGVGRAVTQAAVENLVTIIVADFALSSFASALRDLLGG